MALYDDIGGAPAVRAALDAFYPRVLADATLSPFFAVFTDLSAIESEETSQDPSTI